MSLWSLWSLCSFPLSLRLRCAAPAVIVGAFLGTAPAGPGRTQPGQEEKTEYTVRRIYKDGEVDRYKMSMQMNFQSEQAGASGATFVLTIKETTRAKGDGSAVLTDEAEEAYLKLGEQEMEFASSLPKMTHKHGRDGKTTEIKSEGGSGNIARFGGMVLQLFPQAQSVLYPPRPVKVGDTWKIDPQDAAARGPAPRLIGTASFVGTETWKGRKTLKVKIDVSVAPQAGAGGKMRLDSIGNIDTETGKILRIVGKTDSDGPMGRSRADLELTMLEADPKADAAKKSEKPAPKPNP